jgi:hypothetical protein
VRQCDRATERQFFIRNKFFLNLTIALSHGRSVALISVARSHSRTVALFPVARSKIHREGYQKRKDLQGKGMVQKDHAQYYEIANPSFHPLPLARHKKQRRLRLLERGLYRKSPFLQLQNNHLHLMTLNSSSPVTVW